MSRIANQPIAIDSKINFDVKDNVVTIKGPKGELSMQMHEAVSVEQNDGELNVKANNEEMIYMAGTMRSLLNNMVEGVTNGFTKKLELVGVGYRVAMKGKDLDLNLGFSHPVIYPARDGISFETPSQTEIVVTGADKQQVG